jgi:enamine deaminase RidA (YjgF/YER057c/UK114 family)
MAEGSMIFLAGQIGWDATTGRVAEGMAAQVELAMRNIATLLAEAGAESTDIVRLTWFVTDMDQYRQQTRSIGQAYRRIMNKHFPTMSVIGVNCLVEPDALVEIEATAMMRER